MSALSPDQRLAVIRPIYGRIQLKREYAHEYHEGRIAYAQGHRFDSCQYAVGSEARGAWALGYSDARRDDGS